MKTKFCVVLFSSLILLLTVPSAFSTPLFTPIAVTFDDSKEVKMTTSTLVDSYPNLLLMEYKDRNTLLNILYLTRSRSEIILIGHGGDNGILDHKGELVLWETIGYWLNRLPNNEVIFLSCNSERAELFVTKKSHGFSGIIDGRLGALSIASKLFHSRGLYSEAMNLFQDILFHARALRLGLLEFISLREIGNDNPSPTTPTTPTYIIPNPWGSGGMGWVEIFWDLGNIAMLIGSVFLTYSGPWVVPYIGITITAASITLLNMLANFLAVIANQMSCVAAVGAALISLIPYFAEFLIEKVAPKLGWIKAALVATDVTTQAGVTMATGGQAVIIKIIQIGAIVAGVLWWLAGAWSDLTDADDKANMPSWIFGG